MKKPLVAFSPCDDNNLPHFLKLQASLRKFHTEEELPLIRYDLTEVQGVNKWYFATPLIARELLDQYETVVKLDSDQIILSSLSDIWQGEFDVATVLNDPSYPIQVWDIHPYFNLGLVVMKNKEFVEHWFRLTQSEHFNHYQFREQDLMNILTSDYFNYKVRVLDDTAIYGEFAKPFWPQVYLKDGKPYFKIEGKEVELKVAHFGGGNDPSKGNFKIRFNPEMVKYIEGLLK